MFSIRALNMMLALIVFVFSAASSAKADPFVFSGTFTQDDDVRLFNFSVTTSSTIRLFTTSYAGGRNVDGTTTSAGGFDPVLTLFNAAGNFLADADGPVIEANPVDPLRDAEIITSLSAGNYILAVTQFDNFANGRTLAEGFFREGQGNYTGTNGFVDFLTGEQRTNQFTVNVQPIPEPATIALLGTGLAGIAAGVRRRQRK